MSGGHLFIISNIWGATGLAVGGNGFHLALQLIFFAASMVQIWRGK